MKSLIFLTGLFFVLGNMGCNQNSKLGGGLSTSSSSVGGSSSPDSNGFVVSGSQPLSSNLNSPFNVNVQATSSIVAQIIVLLDNVQIGSASGNSISLPVSATAGTHTLTFRALDSSGNIILAETLTITVVAGSPAPTPIPSPAPKPTPSPTPVSSAPPPPVPTPVPSSGSCPKGSAYVDGCSGGSAGSPAFSTMLSGYTMPPPWNVAGVHYNVGVPSGTTLKDPTTSALPSGCSFKGTTVTCSGTVTLDSYDFSLHTGTSLSITGGSVTIQNSLFVVGSNQGPLGRIISVSGTSNATFLHNEINGANIGVTVQAGQTINASNSGTDTFRYNYLHNSGGDMIDFSEGPQVNIVQYNLFKDIGLVTGHSDTIQWCASKVSNSDISFNLIAQTVAGLSGEGLMEPNSECTGADMSNLLVHNNTLISKVSDNFATGADVTQDAGSASGDHVAVFDNYVDPTGINNFTGSPWFPTGYYGSTLPVPSALHSLIDMTKGSAIPVPSSSSKTSQGYYVYPDAAGYTPGLSDLYSISASPASGSVSAGQTILITLIMDEPWTVTGAPTLSLNSGGTASYKSGSGSNTLIFSYTVASGQSATNLSITAVNLNGGTIKDAVGNSANMAGAITTFSGLNL